MREIARFFTAVAFDSGNQHVDVVANTFMTTLLDHYPDLDFHASLVIKFKIMGLYCLFVSKRRQLQAILLLLLQTIYF